MVCNGCIQINSRPGMSAMKQMKRQCSRDIVIVWKERFVCVYEKFSKFFMAKSKRTGIRLRVNTFGDSQSWKKLTYTSPTNFEYLPPENRKQQSPTLNDN